MTPVLPSQAKANVNDVSKVPHIENSALSNCSS